MFSTSDSRRDHPGRTMLAVALLLSVLIHVTAGGVWSQFGRRIASAIARVVPQPKQTPPELAAISDAITISRVTVPRASRRAPPAPQPARPQPRRIAVVTTPEPVPTVPPTVEPTVRPTTEPTRVPTPHPVPHAAIHVPRPVPSTPPAPRPVARNVLSPQQIAAMESQFQNTIAQTQGGATDVRPQREPPSAQRRFDMVMKGSQRELVGLQGQCHSVAPYLISGMYIRYYLACAIVYADGYSETAVIPWPMSFRMDNDPMRDGRPFPPQGPPPGYQMPATFELSRFVCLYYRPACSSEISRERAAGAAPP